MEERITNLEKQVSEMRIIMNSQLGVRLQRQSNKLVWIMAMVIIGLCFVLGAMAQDPADSYLPDNSGEPLVSSPIFPPVMMQAIKIETKIDEKFRVIQYYLTEANQQVKTMIANEAISGEVKNREAVKKLISDLQAVMKVNRAKFITATFDTIQVDSLATINEKASLLKEITRLKAEIMAGEDSVLIQPKINELLNKRNEITKIIRTWKPVL